MNENKQSKFRWGIWLSIFSIIVAVAVIALIVIKQQPDVVYNNVNSPRPVTGNPAAKVTLVEFSDFECPACGQVFPIVENLVTRYGKDFRFEFKHFPLTNIHKDAYNAALASECANDQAKFWDYYKTLYQNQTKLSVADLKKYAVDLKLDTVKFDACLDTKAKKKVVDEDIKEAKAKNLSGTPTFFLNGQQVNMQSYADLETALKAAITGVQQGPVK
ncbi:MAG: thioredoxin domain-containing protein [Patescibacteria group bacterium]|jgi:protein-disulfide isomerase